jgi:hypothetical protein
MAGPKPVVRDSALAGQAGFELAVISDHRGAAESIGRRRRRSS